MIDSKCPIWQSGKGFCWAPSSAWGCSDAELCGKCQMKERPNLKPLVMAEVVPSRFVCICGRGKKEKRTHCQRCIFEQGRKQVYVARKRAVA